MRKLGIIGGLSWASTSLYYRHINKAVQKRTNAGCSAPLLIESLNSCDLSRLSSDEQWAHAQTVLIESAQRLETAGAGALLIAANSMYRLYDAVQAAIGIPVIHIVEATAAAVKAGGHRNVAIIGTKNVMTEKWYRQRMVGQGLVLSPPDLVRADAIDTIVYDELMLGRETEASRRAMRTMLTDIAKDDDIEALVLACTELVMLVDPDANILPVYDSTRLHALAGVDWIMGDAP
jgi:aspartate racemase